MLKIAILISGRGSNMQALIDATRRPGWPVQIACVISNNPAAKGLERAQAAHIPTQVINHKDYQDRQQFEQVLDAALSEAGVQLICLAGFMRLLTPWFVDRWRDRLINIHPSLLPAFPGLNTHQAALDYGAKLAGCTVHFVRSEMDHGPIIIQAAVPVRQDDTEESLAARILGVEHQIYPHAVTLIAQGRVNVINERVYVVDAHTPDVGLFNPADPAPLDKMATPQ